MANILYALGFYDTFEDCDKRKAAILCKYDTNEGKTKDRNSGMVGALPLKYTDTQFKHAGIQKAFPVIRYAEVLLSYAEAENELNGPTQNAQNAIQPILTRANVTIPATAIANKEAFRDYLLEERGRELHCEGQRRQDLIRHGVYIERAKSVEMMHRIIRYCSPFRKSNYRSERNHRTKSGLYELNP